MEFLMAYVRNLQSSYDTTRTTILRQNARSRASLWNSDACENDSSDGFLNQVPIPEETSRHP